MGVICLMSGFITALFLQTVAAVTLKTRAPFYRETVSNAYNPVLYPIANVLVEVPWVAAFSLAVSVLFMCIVACFF